MKPATELLGLTPDTSLANPASARAGGREEADGKIGGATAGPVFWAPSQDLSKNGPPGRLAWVGPRRALPGGAGAACAPGYSRPVE